MTKLIPHLWYNKEAEEAARFYASVLPNSHVDSVSTLPSETPSGPPGSVTIVEFTLVGVPFQAISAGPLDTFNHSISFIVECKNQAEIDRLWDALGKGGQVEQCGWLKDRYGLSWQIIPQGFHEMMQDKDPARRKRVVDAMLQMVKFDIAGLEKAYAGKS
jgi:predicted 3-demethylubiquinone-9 3-methyltransferase (glyoxalase superfamily)